MTQGRRSLPNQVRAVLLEAGTWVSRVEIDARVVASRIALDDALADLVEAGRAEYRENVGYRIAATPLCRRALQQLQAERTQFAAAGAPRDGSYHLGVAELRPDVGLVLYELALPPVPGKAAVASLQAQATAALDFIETRGGRGGRTDL